MFQKIGGARLKYNKSKQIQKITLNRETFLKKFKTSFQTIKTGICMSKNPTSCPRVLCLFHSKNSENVVFETLKIEIMIECFISRRPNFSNFAFPKKTKNIFNNFWKH